MNWPWSKRQDKLDKQLKHVVDILDHMAVRLDEMKRNEALMWKVLESKLDKASASVCQPPNGLASLSQYMPNPVDEAVRKIRSTGT